jgi:hypothetical protein
MATPGFTNPINQFLPKNASNPTDILDAVKSQLFPSIHLSATAELAVAAVLCAGGVLCMLIGHRFLRVFIAASAFVYVTIISAYATHNLLSTSYCEIYVKRDELCPWGVIAGMVLGLMVAGATARAETAAILFTGAFMGAVLYFFINPLIQSIPSVPSWFQYMGYFFFMAGGAAAAKKWQEQFSITLSSVVGAALLLLSLSHFIQDGFLISNFSGSLSSPCHSTVCWVVIFACIFLCVASVIFQTKWAQRRALQVRFRCHCRCVLSVCDVCCLFVTCAVFLTLIRRKMARRRRLLSKASSNLNKQCFSSSLLTEAHRRLLLLSTSMWAAALLLGAKLTY